MLIGKKCSPKLASEIVHMFNPHPEDPARLVHDRLDFERIKQTKTSEINTTNGHKGGMAKSKRNGSEIVATATNPPDGNVALHIASSIAIATPVKLKRAKALSGSDEPAKVTKREYDILVSGLQEQKADNLKIWNEVKMFIATNKPEFVEPYMDIWNIFAAKQNPKLSLLEGASIGRDKKFKTRIREDSFDFLKILAAISKSDFLKGKDGGWRVDWTFIFENDTNYLKILEGKYK